MPRPSSIPAYKLHKSSGQARVVLNGKHIYLGLFGTPESREKYARMIAEHYASGGTTVTDPADAMESKAPRYSQLSVNELLLKYINFARSYYAQDGKPTGELHNMQDAARSLKTLYGVTHADAFGPRALKLVRENLITVENLSRGVVNGRIDRIKRIFRWAVSEELVPPSVYEGLRAVAGLRYGRSNARETEPVGPVADESVEATIKFLPPQLADMVRLQRITGIRSDNLTGMQWCEIDRTGKIWIFEPSHHKTRHHKKRLRVLIGPQGQAILQKYLHRQPQEYLFSPAEVEEWRAEDRRQKKIQRKTPVYPCEIRRLQREKQARRRRIRNRPPGAHFTSHSYRRAVAYAIKSAAAAGVKIPSWHPHQLRHTRATEVRRQFGIEGAQLILGHSKASITEVYAERDLEFAARIARKTG